MKRGGLGHQAAATVADRESELADSYHTLLRSDEQLCRSTYDALVEAHDAMRLAFQGRLLCTVLRPRFLTAARLAQLRWMSETLAQVLERAGEFLLSSETALDLLGTSEEERAIWAFDPGYPGFTLTSRLDSFMVGDQPKFVEYNAESPAGIGYTDVLADIFADLPCVQEWEHRTSLRRFYGRRHLLETLLWACREWGGRDTPSIAVIDWPQVSTRRDFELCAEYFRREGIPTLICDPRSLQYRGGRLWSGSEPITLVYRRVLLHELLAKAQEAQPLLRAYRDGAICMVNSPRSKLLHKKGLFALLSDRQLGLDLNPEEQSVVDASIPWTRLVRSEVTLYERERVDLPGFVLAHQDRLVLKPADDYGGRGVALGWEVSPGEWQQSLEKALQEHYVVQERVPVPEAEFPVWDSDSIRMLSFLLDTNPLLFRGKLGSVLTRISESALLNVSAGTGSTTPTFAV
jgi:uncharacterized circularly permuted ATP-grasp superfamily protein